MTYKNSSYSLLGQNKLITNGMVGFLLNCSFLYKFFFFAFPLANTGQAEYSCQMKESTVKWLLPLGQKWSPQDFRRFCTGHRTKQTLKFIYRRFNLCDLVLPALKLEHRIFSMAVPLLNFVILCRPSSKLNRAVMHQSRQQD